MVDFKKHGTKHTAVTYGLCSHGGHILKLRMSKVNSDCTRYFEEKWSECGGCVWVCVCDGQVGGAQLLGWVLRRDFPERWPWEEAPAEGRQFWKELQAQDAGNKLSVFQAYLEGSVAGVRWGSRKTQEWGWRAEARSCRASEAAEVSSLDFILRAVRSYKSWHDRFIFFQRLVWVLCGEWIGEVKRLASGLWWWPSGGGFSSRWVEAILGGRVGIYLMFLSHISHLHNGDDTATSSPLIRQTSECALRGNVTALFYFANKIECTEINAKIIAGLTFESWMWAGKIQNRILEAGNWKKKHNKNWAVYLCPRNGTDICERRDLLIIENLYMPAEFLERAVNQSWIGLFPLVKRSLSEKRNSWTSARWSLTEV